MRYRAAEGDLTISGRTLMDRSLDHQVILWLDTTAHVQVSCNCLSYVDDKGRIMYKSMGVSNDIEDTRSLYNLAANHLKPFGPEDVAKW